MMNKKKITIAMPEYKTRPLPEDALKAMDSWVQGTPPVVSQKTKHETQKRINFNVNEELFIKFRKYCVDQKTTMAAKLMELINRELS